MKTYIGINQIWKQIHTGEVLRITSHVADNIWQCRYGNKNIEIAEFAIRKGWKLISPKKGRMIYQYKSKLHEVLWDDGEELGAIVLGEKRVTAGNIKTYNGKERERFAEVGDQLSKKLLFGVRGGI